MAKERSERTLVNPAVLWCVVATLALITAIQLGRAFGLLSNLANPWRDASWLALFLGWVVTLAVAVLATW